MQEILAALKATLLACAKDQKAVASLTTAVAATLVLIASKFHLDWLDPDTAKLIAGTLVVKGSVYVLGEAHENHGAGAVEAHAALVVPGLGLKPPAPSAAP